MQDGAPIIIKKVKKGGHGHHGGGWKVALADFMTSMMAFFMVMWIVGMSQEDREIIEAYFNDPTGFETTMPRSALNIGITGGPQSKRTGKAGTGTTEEEKEIDAAVKLKNMIQKSIEGDPELKGLLMSDKVEVSVSSEGVLVEFIENEANGEVFFKIGSATIRPAARSLIAKVAPLLAQSRRPMQIEGHTDRRPFPGTGRDNFDLSTERAHTVRRLMVASGVQPKQILQVIGYADTRPRNGMDPLHFSNRRVSVLLPFAMTKPEDRRLPVDELNQSIEGMFRVPAAPSFSSPGPEPVNLDPDAEEE